MSWPPKWSIDPDRHLTYDEYVAKYGLTVSTDADTQLMDYWESDQGGGGW